MAELIRKKIILDTDIGPDCDDAGAMAVIHSLRASGEAEILAVTHCTSSPWGAGCVDAINRYFGCPDIPVGTLKDQGFLIGEDYCRYNRHIAMNYPNRFLNEEAPDAVMILRKVLAEHKGDGLIFISIGPFGNLKNLLLSGPDSISVLTGIELVRESVSELVCMGGCFANQCEEGYLEAEFNIQIDLDAAKTVCELWPASIIFCSFEIGFGIMTGRLLKDLPERNPIKAAYTLYTPGGIRHSWDPATVFYAVRRDDLFWDISEAGDAYVTDSGKTVWTQSALGTRRYMIDKGKKKEAEEMLDALIAYEPNC